MEWYVYYLIVGIYVGITMYGASIIYKVKNEDYVRINGLITWKWIYGLPITILLWWFVLIGLCFETMVATHEKQKRIALEVDFILKGETK